jgi:hypothetical protein
VTTRKPNGNNRRWVQRLALTGALVVALCALPIIWFGVGALNQMAPLSGAAGTSEEAPLPTLTLPTASGEVSSPPGYMPEGPEPQPSVPATGQETAEDIGVNCTFFREGEVVNPGLRCPLPEGMEQYPPNRIWCPITDGRYVRCSTAALEGFAPWQCNPLYPAHIVCRPEED